MARALAGSCSTTGPKPDACASASVGEASLGRRAGQEPPEPSVAGRRYATLPPVPDLTLSMPHVVHDATPQAPGYDLARWRSRIPLLAHAIPMNNCSQAPQIDATRAAADAYLDSWARDGMDWDAWMTEVERARMSFARLINADADEVAVTSSVSHAASAFASA